MSFIRCIFLTSFFWQYVHNDQAVLLRRIGTGAFERITAPYQDERVEITRTGDRVVAFVKNANTRIVMNWYTDYMNYDVHVPRAFCRNSVGHLGNCDGDQTNDISLPDQRE